MHYKETSIRSLKIKSNETPYSYFFLFDTGS